jgi:hypothetical protein
MGRRPLTAEARVRARFSSCGICGGQSGTGDVENQLKIVSKKGTFLDEMKIKFSGCL